MVHCRRGSYKKNAGVRPSLPILLTVTTTSFHDVNSRGCVKDVGSEL
jgi:hypothetical protein